MSNLYHVIQVMRGDTCLLMSKIEQKLWHKESVSKRGKWRLFPDNVKHKLKIGVKYYKGFTGTSQECTKFLTKESYKYKPTYWQHYHPETSEDTFYNRRNKKVFKRLVFWPNTGTPDVEFNCNSCGKDRVGSLRNLVVGLSADCKQCGLLRTKLRYSTSISSTKTYSKVSYFPKNDINKRHHNSIHEHRAYYK